MVERPDLPLFAWSDDLHRRRRTRDRARRPALGMIAAAVTLALAATIVRPPHPRLIWNASASAPIGLYRVTSGSGLRAGDMVIAWAPAEARTLAARRHYLPLGVPLVKRVAAVSGDRVCAIGPVISINGKPIAARRRFDRQGRVLPWWRGCVRLGAGELFLLMRGAPDSFDGRYFGPTHVESVVGAAHLLWAGS